MTCVMARFGRRSRRSRPRFSDACMTLLGLRNAVVVTTFGVCAAQARTGPRGPRQQAAAERHEDLPEIPVFDVGPAFAIETAHLAGRERAYAMLDAATAGVPMLALRLADAISRRWLSAQRSPICRSWISSQASAAAQGVFSQRPLRMGMHDRREAGHGGGYRRAAPARARLGRERSWPAHRCGADRERLRPLGLADLARLHRRTAGDGAGAVRGGDRSTETRRQADGHFLRRLALSKRNVWRSHHVQPIHLLRRVFEEAPDFAAARRMLEATPICTPAIYTLRGSAGERGVRYGAPETAARVCSTSACAANEWQTPEWHPGITARFENAKRLAAMQAAPGALDLTWLHWPILNKETRLALAADAAQGCLVRRATRRRVRRRDHSADPSTLIGVLVVRTREQALRSRSARRSLPLVDAIEHRSSGSRRYGCGEIVRRHVPREGRSLIIVLLAASLRAEPSERAGMVEPSCRRSLVGRRRTTAL